MQHLQRFFKLTEPVDRTIINYQNPAHTHFLYAEPGTPGVFVYAAVDAEFKTAKNMRRCVKRLKKTYNITWFDRGLSNYFPTDTQIFHYAVLFMEYGRVLITINPERVELL